MIKILFFAQIRELIGVSSVDFHINENMTVINIIEQLSQQGSQWQLALSNKDLLCAVNKSLVNFEYIVKENDEVAFFPPVTGG